MNQHTAVAHRVPAYETDLYLNNAEPMRQPDYRAKKHGKPMPARYKRAKAGRL